MFKIYKGDCLIESESIGPGSIDLILTDPPYGNMDTDGGRKLGINLWDKVIDPADIFGKSNALLRKNGKLILFSQEPYTSDLMLKSIPNLKFNYRATWLKDNFANALGVNKNLVSFTEDILIFTKVNPVHDSEFIHPLRPYFEEIHRFIDRSKSRIIQDIGQGADHVFRYGSSQFALCTEETYSALIAQYNINKMVGFKAYAILTKTDAPFRADLLMGAKKINPNVFNLWERGKFKSNVFQYRKDYDGYHPTQKPVLLLEDLIKTYSNVGDTVLDLTMGSGSTGVACMNTGRKFIGIEKDEGYFEKAKNRIENASNFNMY